jgi:hypothetical protein
VPLFVQRHVSQFKTRRDGGQFTQPVRIFSGTAPRQKADSENQLRVGIATTLPRPGSRPGGQGRGLSVQDPGVLIGPVRPRRSIGGVRSTGLRQQCWPRVLRSERVRRRCAPHAFRIWRSL